MEEQKHRVIAMSCFGGVALLAAGLFFFHRPIALHAVVLFILLPTLAAGGAGFIWGGRILDSSRTTSFGAAAMRGMGVTLGAYPIFAVLFAIGIAFTERGWNAREIPGLFLLALMFGFLMSGSFMLLAGAIAGAGLYGLRSYTSRRSALRAELPE